MDNITICNARNEKPKYPYDVWICRKRSILGNPFTMPSEEYRNNVCDKYERWFKLNITILTNELERLQSILHEYGQLRLFCWCHPKRCHAETIKRWLDDAEYVLQAKLPDIKEDK